MEAKNPQFAQTSHDWYNIDPAEREKEAKAHEADVNEDFSKATAQEEAAKAKDLEDRLHYSQHDKIRDEYAGQNRTRGE
jgi:hypothetical protein